MSVDTCSKWGNHTPGHTALVFIQVYTWQRVIIWVVSIWSIWDFFLILNSWYSGVLPQIHALFLPAKRREGNLESIYSVLPTMRMWESDLVPFLLDSHSHLYPYMKWEVIKATKLMEEKKIQKSKKSYLDFYSKFLSKRYVQCPWYHTCWQNHILV